MKQQSGFSLIELMISLVLGLVILSGVIQVFVSTRATNSLNQAIAEVQEYGRYITLRLQDELREVGRYDLNTTDIEDSTDLVLESSCQARIQKVECFVFGGFHPSGTDSRGFRDWNQGWLPERAKGPWNFFSPFFL